MPFGRLAAKRSSADSGARTQNRRRSQRPTMAGASKVPRNVLGGVHEKRVQGFAVCRDFQQRQRVNGAAVSSDVEERVARENAR